MTSMVTWGTYDALTPRDVVLGRSQHVRRILPNRERRMIGAWCFLDHYGPDDITAQGGMWVPPHPHAGLQTVTWLFEGLGLHTDSLGSRQQIRPGQLNVMTAGAGICHAEVSPPDAPDTLHGVQLWVCLPDGIRDATRPAFDHLGDLPQHHAPGVVATVLVGDFAGAVSGAPAYTPLVGVEVRMEPGARIVLPLEQRFEHGVLAVDTTLLVGEAQVPGRGMVYLGSGRAEVSLQAPDGGIALLLGGEPFDEDIVMWWNFVGRSHEEVLAMRESWNEGGFDGRPARFGAVEGFPERRLLAPALPTVRLKPRGRGPS